MSLKTAADGQKITHHRLQGQFALDIDGVICCDPTPEEVENYDDFLRSAQPLFIPPRVVGWLVTTRLEIHRQPTEEWLQQHGVKYRELIMLNAPDRKSKGDSRQQGAFKAGIYKNIPAILFVESCPHQAQVIARLSQKIVYCVGDQRFYGGWFTQ